VSRDRIGSIVKTRSVEGERETEIKCVLVNDPEDEK